MQQQTEITGVSNVTSLNERGAVVSVSAIKRDIEELVDSCVRMQEASEEFSTLIKATAERSGVMAPVLRRFVRARASTKFEQKRAEIQQLSLVFEEFGEG